MVFQHQFELLDQLDSLGYVLTKVVQSLDQLLLVKRQAFDFKFVPLNVSEQVVDLGGLKLDCLVKVNSLLTNHIQLQDLVIYDFLSFFESDMDLADLVFNLGNLVLCVQDHLVQVLDLSVEMVDEFFLLGLLVDVFT